MCKLYLINLIMRFLNGKFSLTFVNGHKWKRILPHDIYYFDISESRLGIFTDSFLSYYLLEIHLFTFFRSKKPCLQLSHDQMSQSRKKIFKFFSNSSSVQFSRSVVSNSLQPHELQHARPPCPSPTPRVHSGSHPSSQ